MHGKRKWCFPIPFPSLLVFLEPWVLLYLDTVRAVTGCRANAGRLWSARPQRISPPFSSVCPPLEGQFVAASTNQTGVAGFVVAFCRSFLCSSFVLHFSINEQRIGISFWFIEISLHRISPLFTSCSLPHLLLRCIITTIIIIIMQQT